MTRPGRPREGAGYDAVAEFYDHVPLYRERGDVEFYVVKRDPERQLQHIEFSYRIADAAGRTQVRTHRFAMRYFFRYELEHLLERAGFRVERFQTDFDSGNGAELVFVCRVKG